MEAQSQGLTCIATRVSAIPELITHGETGILVESRDRAELSRALAGLIAEPARRRQLGQAGQERVRSQFSHNFWIRRLARKFALPEMAADADTGPDGNVGKA